MNDGSFSVNLAQLDDLVARLTGLTGFLTDTFDAIDHQVTSLHNGSWDGIAAQAYADAHQAWSSEAHEFAQGIADITDAAKHAHARYTSAVDVNTTMTKG